MLRAKHFHPKYGVFLGVKPGFKDMGTCHGHPMASLKYIHSVTSLPVKIKLRNKINELGSQINENYKVIHNYNAHANI